MPRAVFALLLVACSGGPGPRSPERSDGAAPADRSDAGIQAAATPSSADAGDRSMGPLAAELASRFKLPDEPGRAHSEVKGCAAHPEAADQPPTRAVLPPARLVVQPVRGGVLVTHDLPHACCLKGVIGTRVEGNVATVHEALTGTPCRCMCESTLRTGAALAPGRYRVVVELERGDRTDVVGEETVSVP